MALDDEDAARRAFPAPAAEGLRRLLRVALLPVRLERGHPRARARGVSVAIMSAPASTARESRSRQRAVSVSSVPTLSLMPRLMDQRGVDDALVEHRLERLEAQVHLPRARDEPDGVDEAGREPVGVTAEVETGREPDLQVGRDRAQPAEVPVGATRDDDPLGCRRDEARKLVGLHPRQRGRANQAQLDGGRPGHGDDERHDVAQPRRPVVDGGRKGPRPATKPRPFTHAGRPRPAPTGARRHDSSAASEFGGSAPQLARRAVSATSRSPPARTESGCGATVPTTSVLPVPVVELLDPADHADAAGGTPSPTAGRSRRRSAHAYRTPGTSARPGPRGTCGQHRLPEGGRRHGPRGPDARSSPRIRSPAPSRTTKISSSAEWQCGATPSLPGCTATRLRPVRTEPAAVARSRRDRATVAPSRVSAGDGVRRSRSWRGAATAPR